MLETQRPSTVIFSCQENVKMIEYELISATGDTEITAIDFLHIRDKSSACVILNVTEMLKIVRILYPTGSNQNTGDYQVYSISSVYKSFFNNQ